MSLCSVYETGIFEEIIPTLDLPKNELEQFANDVIERFKKSVHQALSFEYCA